MHAAPHRSDRNLAVRLAEISLCVAAPADLPGVRTLTAVSAVATAAAAPPLRGHTCPQAWTLLAARTPQAALQHKDETVGEGCHSGARHSTNRTPWRSAKPSNSSVQRYVGLFRRMPGTSIKSHGVYHSRPSHLSSQRNCSLMQLTGRLEDSLPRARIWMA